MTAAIAHDLVDDDAIDQWEGEGGVVSTLPVSCYCTGTNDVLCHNCPNGPKVVRASTIDLNLITS